MAWKFGWLPDESSLLDLAGRNRNTGIEAESERANATPAKRADKDQILFGETRSEPLTEDEVYRRLAEQTNKRRNERSTDQSPGLLSAQQENSLYRQPAQSDRSLAFRFL